MAFLPALAAALPLAGSRRAGADRADLPPMATGTSLAAIPATDKGTGETTRNKTHDPVKYHAWADAVIAG